MTEAETILLKRSANVHQNGHGAPSDKSERTDLTAGTLRYYRQNERGDAMLFSRLMEGRRLFDFTAGMWRTYEAGIWSLDGKEQTIREIPETLTRVYLRLSKDLDDKIVRLTREGADAAKIDELSRDRDGLRKRADALNKAARVGNVAAFARKYLPAETTDFDRDQLLFNTLNATYDLRTFTVRDHDPEDRITKRASYLFDDSADAPDFLAFLERILGGDPELIRMMQVIFGYLLTGLTDIDLVCIFYGSGGNGKSVLLSVIEMLLGDYYARIPIETLLSKKYGATDEYYLAQLFGVRCCVASEIPQGRHVNESLLKDLSGGDTLTARQPYGRPFNFQASHKLILVGNHKPVIRGSDDGIWRRLRLVPFEVTIPKEERIDRSILLERFRRELPGILNWAIEGYRMYRDGGLEIPATVIKATADYREESDALGSFLADCCVAAGHAKVVAKDLYGAYKAWCEQTSEYAMKSRELNAALRERGFTVEPGTANKTEVKGLGLLSELGS